MLGYVSAPLLSTLPEIFIPFFHRRVANRACLWLTSLYDYSLSLLQRLRCVPCESQLRYSFLFFRQNAQEVIGEAWRTAPNYTPLSNMISVQSQRQWRTYYVLRNSGKRTLQQLYELGRELGALTPKSRDSLHSQALPARLPRVLTSVFEQKAAASAPALVTWPCRQRRTSV